MSAPRTPLEDAHRILERLRKRFGIARVSELHRHVSELRDELAVYLERSGAEPLGAETSSSAGEFPDGACAVCGRAVNHHARPNVDAAERCSSCESTVCGACFSSSEGRCSDCLGANPSSSAETSRGLAYDASSERFIVVCREDVTPDGAPGAYTLATRRTFPDAASAETYARGINASRSPLVVSGRFGGLR